jgi:hypothetical protein
LTSKALLGGARSVVSHPAFLLLLGAAISGYLIPSFSQRSQNHQKELDVKSRLVTETSAALATYRGTIRRLYLGGGKLSAIDDAFKKWDIDSETIRSELEAYFPRNKRLLSAWDNLDTGVTGSYYVLANRTPEARFDTYGSYRQYIGQPDGGYAATRRAPVFRYSIDRVPADSLGAYDISIANTLLFPLLLRQRAINDTILSSPSAF